MILLIEVHVIPLFIRTPYSYIKLTCYAESQVYQNEEFLLIDKATMLACTTLYTALLTQNIFYSFNLIFVFNVPDNFMPIIHL